MADALLEQASAVKPRRLRRNEQRVNWRPIFGSRMTPELRDTGVLDENSQPIMEPTGKLVKQWSHREGAILASAPKRTKGEPSFQIVWKDHSLRNITAKAAELLGTLPLHKRVAQLEVGA